MKRKLAYIGGGSLFVPSIINGIGRAMRESPEPYAVEIALYDIHPEKAQPMAAYAGVVARAWGVPLSASVPAAREAALEGADVVLASVWLEEEHRRIDALWQDLGVKLPEEGPGVAAWAAACAPWSLGLAREMWQRCPDGLFVTLMNPTDVIAGLAGAAVGVGAAGLCVEVDGLRGVLAYYFHVPFDSIELVHAGVNHDGWVLDLRVNGEDGYRLWADRWQEIEQDPDYHPGNRIIPRLLQLTGRLRSSGYHQWPYQVEQTPRESALWQSWRGKRELYETALGDALQAGQPISDPPGIHPERSRVNYPFTGLAIGRWMRSIATGQQQTLTLQVPNRGAVSNFPDEAVVEVPVRVRGKGLEPVRVGEVPDWLGGYTRLQAIQRRMFVNYMLERDLVKLKQALAVLPMFATAQQMNRFAELIHERF